MSINKTLSALHPNQGSRPVFEREVDAYRSKGKLAEPTVCPKCGAVYHAGRWQWIDAPADAHAETCPACHRIHDNYPAGFVTLKGAFLSAHSEEIKKIIQHHAEHERAEHPLKRIMAIDDEAGMMLVTTTDTHLARGIGEAVHNAYQGELKVEHSTGENLVRVYWQR
jgi:NMD protein affecting ribosome stability and mRNA decay